MVQVLDGSVYFFLESWKRNQGVQEFIYGRTGVATPNIVHNPARFRSPNLRPEFNPDKAAARVAREIGTADQDIAALSADIEAYQGGFATNLMLKDLLLAMEAAEQANAAVPMGARAAELYQEFANLGQGNVDFSGIIRMLEASGEA